MFKMFMEHITINNSKDFSKPQKQANIDSILPQMIELQLN